MQNVSFHLSDPKPVPETSTNIHNWKNGGTVPHSCENKEMAMLSKGQDCWYLTVSCANMGTLCKIHYVILYDHNNSLGSPNDLAQQWPKSR